MNKKYSRFRLVKKPLTAITDNEEIRKSDFPFSKLLKESKYPVRALRYWWLHCIIKDEMKDKLGVVTIVDVGCDTGIIKRFIPPVKNSRWIGLDIITTRAGLEVASYDELYQCDFNVNLPLEDDSAEIVICSHVLEHLPRPEFTMGELARILKPGGMLLVGVPIAPQIIAHFRQNQMQEQLENGKRKMGQHVQMFDVKRLKKLAEDKGLKIEFTAGTAMIRKKGSRLENSAAWIRFNQIWAAVFPSLSQELCLQIRKPL